MHESVGDCYAVQRNFCTALLQHKAKTDNHDIVIVMLINYLRLKLSAVLM